MTLEGDRLRARGVQIGADPRGYRLEYELETAERYVTARLSVRVEGDGGSRSLELTEEPGGRMARRRRARGPGPGRRARLRSGPVAAHELHADQAGRRRTGGLRDGLGLGAGPAGAPLGAALRAARRRAACASRLRGSAPTSSSTTTASWRTTPGLPSGSRAILGGRGARTHLPPHHLRVPDERARLGAHEGHARLARLRRGGGARRRRPDPLQHLLDPREGGHPAGRAPRRGQAPQDRGPEPRGGRGRLLVAVGEGAGVRAVPVRGRGVRARARCTSWPSS